MSRRSNVPGLPIAIHLLQQQFPAAVVLQRDRDAVRRWCRCTAMIRASLWAPPVGTPRPAPPPVSSGWSRWWRSRVPCGTSAATSSCAMPSQRTRSLVRWRSLGMQPPDVVAWCTPGLSSNYPPGVAACFAGVEGLQGSGAAVAVRVAAATYSGGWSFRSRMAYNPCVAPDAELAGDGGVTVYTQEEVTSEELRVDAKVPLLPCLHKSEPS